jgi:WD40 repeat protein
VVSHQPIGPPLSGHSDSILSVVFSPDGKTFASSSASECLLWDLSTEPLTGKLLSEKEGSGGKLAFSQDGRLLAIGSGQDVRLWKALDGVPAAEPLRTNGSWEKCLSFSDDGKMLAAADDFGLSLWSLDAEIPADKPIRANIEFARCVAFKPGGKIIAVGGNDGYLRFWDAETGESTGRPFSGHTAAIRDLAFSPDGEMLASASEDGTVILWKVQPNTPLRQPVGELAGYIVNASFNGDDKILACGTDSGEIVLWDFPYGLANGPKPIPNKRRLVCLAFRSGSEILESYHQDDSLQLWDTRTMQLAAKPFTGLGGNEEMTVFSANGTRLASCIGEKLVVWDTQSGHSIGAPIKVPALSLTSLAFNNDGTKLAAWTSTLDNGPGEIYLWNLTVDPAPIETLSGHREEVLNVAFSPDSKTLASSSLDETIRFWDMESGRQKGPVLADVHRVTEVAFSPDGKILASSSVLPFSHAPSVLQLWDVLTGKPIGQPRAIGSHGSLTRAPFNHSGTLLVTTDVPAGAQPGGKAALTLWDIDLKSWQERACSIANRNLSRREWLYYLENQTYHKTNLNLPEPLIIARPKRIIAEENF